MQTYQPGGDPKRDMFFFGGLSVYRRSSRIISYSGRSAWPKRFGKQPEQCVKSGIGKYKLDLRFYLSRQLVDVLSVS